MKKAIIRWIVIGLTFISALIFFSIYFNKGKTDMTIEMSAPSLPVAYIDVDGKKINAMHGYANRMNPSTLRDSITPLGPDRSVSFVVDKYDIAVSNLRLEVRSADGRRLIEDTKIIQYSDYKDKIEATISLKDLIEENTEYNLCIILELADGRNAFYYTRVIQNEDVSVGEKLSFVTDFCLKTFSKENIKELSTYMESNSDGDNTSLGIVNIHSSLDQLTWGSLSPRMIGTPDITLKEIGDTMASIELEYLVTSRENKTEYYYNVTEYYRIRITPQRTYLLTFDRTMDKIYVMDKDSFINDKVMMGIQSEDVVLSETEDGQIMTFENDGRLYCYNATDNKLVRLFAFYDTSSDDYRSRYREHKVKVLDVEENGNIAFLSYGYMNRGIHEGKVGVILYYYNSVMNTVEEQVFIPYLGSEDVLKCDIDKLSYINTIGDLFILMDGVVYKISPAKQEYSIIADNINENTFFVSKSGKTIVWQEKSEDDNDIASNLSVMSLATGSVNKVSMGMGNCLIPIGFMNEDLIYGISEREAMIFNTLGDITFPLNKIIIQSEDGEILKEYANENIYVTEGSIEGNQITLKRVYRDENTGEYKETTDDHITSNQETEVGKNHLVYAVTDLYEKICQIQLKNIVDAKTLKMLTPKEVIFEGGRNLEIKNNETKNRFLVYGNGEIIGIYDKAAKAVARAYSIRGTVTDISGNEIYRRGETVARNQIMAIGEESITDTKSSLAVCLDTILKYQGISRNTEYMLESGKSVYDILSENIGNAYVLNLTGCTMDMMLYYVNKDIPVLALREDGTAVLIIGFNEQNVVLMDPTEGRIYKSGMKDTKAMFEEEGNRFMTYAVIKSE